MQCAVYPHRSWKIANVLGYPACSSKVACNKTHGLIANFSSHFECVVNAVNQPSIRPSEVQQRANEGHLKVAQRWLERCMEPMCCPTWIPCHQAEFSRVSGLPASCHPILYQMSDWAVHTSSTTDWCTKHSKAHCCAEKHKKLMCLQVCVCHPPLFRSLLFTSWYPSTWL